MIEERDILKLEEFDKKVLENLSGFVSKTDNEEYINASSLIISAENRKNRIHITGIGKPGHVAAYGASLLSSTGTPTYFLHGTEAIHGSSGQLVEGDVVIAISNSGKTEELMLTVEAAIKNGCIIIGISGDRHSWLAEKCNAHIFAGVKEEGDILNRAPRTSILAEVYVMARLSLLLQEYKDITPKKYIRWHPGGALGNLRKNEK